MNVDEYTYQANKSWRIVQNHRQLLNVPVIINHMQHVWYKAKRVAVPTQLKHISRKHIACQLLKTPCQHQHHHTMCFPNMSIYKIFINNIYIDIYIRLQRKHIIQLLWLMTTHYDQELNKKMLCLWWPGHNYWHQTKSAMVHQLLLFTNHVGGQLLFSCVSPNRNPRQISCLWPTWQLVSIPEDRFLETQIVLRFTFMISSCIFGARFCQVWRDVYRIFPPSPIIYI